MCILWNADGDEIRDEYPPWEPHDLLGNSEKTTFEVGEIVAKLQEISGSDVVALHQLAENHYFVIYLFFSSYLSDLPNYLGYRRIYDGWQALHRQNREHYYSCQFGLLKRQNSTRVRVHAMDIFFITHPNATSLSLRCKSHYSLHDYGQVQGETPD